VDRISLIASCGNILHHKSDITARVTLRIHHFYKLSIVKNIKSGRTTSRQAFPLGDGRGRDKCFQDFGKFSKLPLRIYQTFKPRQQPSLLAGFALRRRLRLDVLRSYNQDKSVSIFLLKKGDHSVEAVIQADLSIMDLHQDPSSALSLIDLIADSNFDTKMSEPGFPVISSQDLDLYLDNPCLPPSSPPLEECPIPEENLLLNLVESFPAVVSVPTTSIQTPIDLRQTGPNKFEVIVLPTEPSPVLEAEYEEDQGYVSPPYSPPSYTSSPLLTSSPSQASTSSSSSLFEFNTSEETREEKRLREQREACKRYRENKKRKRVEESQEIDGLERKNRELEMKVKVMKELVEQLRETVMETVTGKRKIKNEDIERNVKVRRT